MITEEQLLDLGFKQVDPVWEENQRDKVTTRCK